MVYVWFWARYLYVSKSTLDGADEMVYVWFRARYLYVSKSTLDGADKMVYVWFQARYLYVSKSTPDEADETVYVWFWARYLYVNKSGHTRTFMISSAPAFTDSVFMQRFRSFLEQYACCKIVQTDSIKKSSRNLFV